MTDFYSQNRCVCSTRSHGPLLCVFYLSFHFNYKHNRYVCIRHGHRVYISVTVVHNAHTVFDLISEHALISGHPRFL